MKDYSNLPYHPTVEKVVDILRRRTQNEDPMFFRLMVSYFFSKIASMMRVNVEIADTQVLPVNMYCINLAPSGSGKGHSVSIMEEEVIGSFRHRFLNDTFPHVAQKEMDKIAIRRATKYNSDPDLEKERAAAEFEELGQLLFSFDSGTSAAIKQMRSKLLYANAGSMNLEMDEIGSNLLGNAEVLNNFLELFDTGRIKQKLTKNTRDNLRVEDMFGSTPTNMFLFGTPTKLLNGAKTEDEFNDFLDIGYARRCFFGFVRFRKTRVGQTAQDIYNIYTDSSVSQYLAKLSTQLGMLADPAGFGHTLKMQKKVSLELFDYRLDCQRRADRLSEYEETKKAEMSHRYFKVAKLAATYAYIDKAIFVTSKHLEYAIALAEASGEAFAQILNRERPYAKLANYIASVGKDLTQADLLEDLPFYKGNEQQKREMLSLAIAHGYKNGIYITRSKEDGIEFLSGKMTEPTDLNKMYISYSDDPTSKYRFDEAPFDQLNKVLLQPNLHWVTHKLRDGYRDDAHCIPGVNMIVLDVENSCSLSTAQMLLKDYKYFMHTTKRHTNTEHRYRIVLPLSHTLELDADTFKEFMKNIYEWLPFPVDTATGQRSRKWLTNNGKSWYNDGKLLESLRFIPKTKKAEELQARFTELRSLDNLERWFVDNIETGNRNHQLLKFALCLVDDGLDMTSVQSRVMALNTKLPDPLDEAELLSTVIVTANRKFSTKGST
jgi:hypothetical protein